MIADNPKPPAPPARHRWARRLLVAVTGATLLLAGAAMIVLPGPAFLVIPAALALLATEFLWARRWLKRLRAAAGLKTDSSP